MSAQLEASDRLLGQILADRYQILHRLGEGAMGVVYKARHVKVGRLFAVKVLHPRVLADPKTARRFEREAELAGRLRHPNVVGVVDVGDVEGTRYMVMDFAEGPDLAKLLDEAPMPPERIICLVRQMLEGLYHAHEQGLIHRDFKPENVIVERDAHGAELPRIVDFGIALLREGGDSTDGAGRLTTNGLVLGTPHYMAPEQAVADPIDHRIDLFALGIVIYEMLSGRLPFDGNGAEVARANLLIDPPPIAKRVEHLEVDPLLEAFARRLMAKSRDHRPATAKAARELLDLIERDRPLAARALGVPVARSGRAPAVTEPVIAGAAGAADMSAATMPMTPTPKHSHAVARSAAPAPAPAADGPPGALAPSPAMQAYPGPLARPEAVLYRGPHAHGAPAHDTALRTPLGWPVASRPSRRRPWLVGGVLVGAASIAVAAVLSLTTGSPDEPAPALRPAASSSAAATAGSTGASGSAATPATEPAPSARPVAAPEAQPSEAEPGAPAPAATDLPPHEPRGDAPAPTGVERKPRDSRGDPGYRPPVPGRVRGKGAAAPSGDLPVTHPDLGGPDPVPVRPPPREVSPREVSPREASPREAPPREASPREAPPREPDVRGQDARPARADAPRAAAPVGIAPGELANLFDAVGREIRQLPGDAQPDLLDQLSRFDILTETRAQTARRDYVAGQLIQIRDEVHRRRAGRKKP